MTGNGIKLQYFIKTSPYNTSEPEVAMHGGVRQYTNTAIVPRCAGHLLQSCESASNIRLQISSRKYLDGNCDRRFSVNHVTSG